MGVYNPIIYDSNQWNILGSARPCRLKKTLTNP